MSKILNSAIEDAKKWLTEDDMKSREDTKNALRTYADECESFQNMIFEIGLKKVIRHL